MKPRPAFSRWACLCIAWLLSARLLPNGNEVVVVYAKGSADSRSVAEYYALQRDVPERQVIGLDVEAPASGIPRADYERRIQEPLIAALRERGLMQFDSLQIAASNGLPAHMAHHCTDAKVRYLLLAWGFPYRIDEDPRWIPSSNTNHGGPLSRTEASVDSELALLPIAGSYPLPAAVPNRHFGATNSAWYHPTNGVLMVTRLDGPTPALAKGLVDKALHAEAHGLSGNAYIDLRNITSGGYKTGDEWITNAATSCKRFGFSTFVDNKPDTLPPTFPMSQIGLYFGWYAWNADGPFTRPEVEFLPGAIAYHIHSFSAGDLRSTTANWVGPFVAKGVTATMGCVAEPYLDLTPNPHYLMELLGARQFTLGEAGIGCQRFLSWMNVVVGDPLYRPFARHWLQWEPIQIAKHDPNLEWTILRRVNTHLHGGRDPATLRQYLVEQPLTTNSPVLAEKVALLFADDGKLREAIGWGRRAADISKSLQQRTRIRLNLASWEETRDDRASALATLRKVEDERPDYRDLATFRQKQLSLARGIHDKAEVDRLQDEIKRIAAANPPPK
ncbi:MAG: TIGR03790 family protein [Verrucomicrobia bacterium]|nr:MAG: TIGR03790 family protein [Verrucomicrobiota bacterium]